MNAEIIYPETKNVIPYNTPILQFHGTVTFDDRGKELSRSPEAGKVFSDAVREVNADRQKTFQLRGPNVVSFADYDEQQFHKHMAQYEQELDAVKSRHGLNDDDTLQDYSDLWWAKLIDGTAGPRGYKLSPEERAGLIRRWARGDTSFGKKHLDGDALEFYNLIEPKVNDLVKKKNAAIERVFLHAGSEIIKRVVDGLAANNPRAAREIKDKVYRMISQVQRTDDPELQKKLGRELKRLDAAGGTKSIAPIEGLVFMYRGRPYKFTGTFAPVNQILGLRGFEGKRDEPAPQVAKPAAKQASSRKKWTGKEKVLNPQTKRKILVKTALQYDKKHPARKAAERMMKNGAR
jgi:hypothetical protein